MPNEVTLGPGPLQVPKVVVAVFGTPTGAQFTVIFSDGSVLDRTSQVDNDWAELTPIPLGARALELDTYTLI